MSDATAESPFYISVVCPTCGVERYRSTRPVSREDRINASDFEALEDGPPPPDNGPMLCHECNSLMRPIKTEDWLKAINRTERTEAPAAPRSETKPIPATRSAVDTVFELREGEAMISTSQLNSDTLLVVTTKRVVKVRF